MDGGVMSAQPNGPGFYRSTGDGQNVWYAANAVNGPNGVNLVAANHAAYVYPVAGWTWYADEDTARAAMGLPSWESLNPVLSFP